MIFLAEGEKDCLNLKNVGITASCNPMGAGKWRVEYNRYFAGKQIIILPDNDEPGRKHAESVARHLHGTAASVKIVELPNLPEKGDVSDWLAAGGTAEELLELAEKAPEWQPSKASQKTKGAVATSKGQDKVHLRAVDADEDPELTPVKSVLPDAPVSHNLAVPKDWSVTPQGIGKIVKSSDGLDVIQVSPAPILINGRLNDLAQGTENLCLTWPRDNEWKLQTVERAKVATTGSITELANVGLPVTSINASKLVEYLAKFEGVNMDCLPRMQVSEQLGWQGDNCSLGFLWGRTLLRADSEKVTVTDLGSLPPEQWQKQLVAFRGADAGDEQIADAFKAAGSLDEWIRTLELMVDYPKVLLAVYGSLAPPLLKIFGTPNFIMDWSGGTSGGKTTTMRIAGSTWSSPDERLAASVVGTWDATRVWISWASTVLQSLTLILDDTKRCKNTKNIVNVVYDVTCGRDRGRGSKGGIRTLGTWSTVLLSTGETPITSFSNDGGTRARVIPVWGSPFGKTDRATASLVQTVNRLVTQNYGLAGPKFVQFLMARQCDWEAWRKEYHKVEAQYQDLVGDDPAAGRLCAYFTVLDMAAGIAHAALELPWSYRDPIIDFIEELISGTAEADVASQALNAVISWAQMNASSFHGLSSTTFWNLPSGKPARFGWHLSKNFAQKDVGDGDDMMTSVLIT